MLYEKVAIFELDDCIFRRGFPLMRLAYFGGGVHKAELCRKSRPAPPQKAMLWVVKLKFKWETADIFDGK